jgi:hypothetical protein
MIRYPIDLDVLEGWVDQEVPGWRVRAADRTESFRLAGRYDENSPIWSEIKHIFMTLQHNKCAYCERQLAVGEFAPVEHDVEHFRPKGAVEEWPPADPDGTGRWRGLAYGFPTGGSSEDGYYLLAYSLRNYATACKPCNSPLKSNYFPIAGPRNHSAEEPAELEPELPFLMYPIGDLDDDPESLMGFEALVPLPLAVSGEAKRRAHVTIDFFGLATREDLLLGRAQVLDALYIALRTIDGPDKALHPHAKRSVTRLTGAQSAHTNCARSFQRLYQKDRSFAEQVILGVQRYLETFSP